MLTYHIDIPPFVSYFFFLLYISTKPSKIPDNYVSLSVFSNKYFPIPSIAREAMDQLVDVEAMKYLSYIYPISISKGLLQKVYHALHCSSVDYACALILISNSMNSLN